MTHRFGLFPVQAPPNVRSVQQDAPYHIRFVIKRPGSRSNVHSVIGARSVLVRRRLRRLVSVLGLFRRFPVGGVIGRPRRALLVSTRHHAIADCHPFFIVERHVAMKQPGADVVGNHVGGLHLHR
jgi:hypothetical protein